MYFHCSWFKCCASFRCTAKWITHIYTHIHTHTHIYPLFSYIGHSRTLSRVGSFYFSWRLRPPATMEMSNAQCFRDPLGDLRSKWCLSLSLCNGRPNLRIISWSNFLLPPQLSQSRWESLQSVLWMYLSWLIGMYTLEKLASGWSPFACQSSPG